MEALREALSAAREAASDAARDAAGGAAEPPPVDVEAEFGDRLAALARSAGEIAGALSDEGKDPMQVMAALQGLAGEVESLAVRYRKVDEEASEAMRRKALEITFGQPRGMAQLARNVRSGVYEGGGTCLPEVVGQLRATCDVIEELGAAVYGAEAPRPAGA